MPFGSEEPVDQILDRPSVVSKLTLFVLVDKSPDVAEDVGTVEVVGGVFSNQGFSLLDS